MDLNLKEILTHWQQRQAHQQLRLAQGRLSEAEAADKLAGEGFIALAEAHGRNHQPSTIHLNEQQLDGHLLVVSPPGRGQDEQLTNTLYAWPDAAIVIDPLGEQYRCSGRFRQVMIGPVYQLPGYRVPLDKYYLLHSKDDAAELYHYLMVTRDAEERPSLDLAFHLFVALGRYAQLKNLNALQVILDGVVSPMNRVLPALDVEPEVHSWLRSFTNGLAPAEAVSDAQTITAFAALTHQLHRYQSHIDTICPELTAKEILPRDWAAQKGTVYITYDSITLAEIGGLIASIVAALVRYHLSFGNAQRLLVVMGDTVARHINHLEVWLRLLRDYDIMVRLAIPSASGIQGILNLPEQNSLLAHFDHQLWYAPNDLITADAMSGLLSGSPAKTEAIDPTTVRFTPAELMALPEDKVLVLTRRERQYRFLAHRIHLDEADKVTKPPPLPPKRAVPLRYLIDWPEPKPVTSDSTLPVDEPLSPTASPVTETGGVASSNPGVPSVANPEKWK